MVNLRRQSGRFNVLLTEDRRQTTEHWSRQLPRLLQPQGVQSFVARSAREAVELVTAVRIHAALVDLATPPGESAGPGDAAPHTGHSGGLWLLETLRRLPDRPAVVVVNDVRLTPRQAQRVLNDALRLGAFSVVDRPQDLEALLSVFRRLLDRRYQGHWPSPESERPDPSSNGMNEPQCRHGAGQQGEACNEDSSAW